MKTLVCVRCLMGMTMDYRKDDVGNDIHVRCYNDSKREPPGPGEIHYSLCMCDYCLSLDPGWS